jgi:hypothetical protein
MMPSGPDSSAGNTRASVALPLTPGGCRFSVIPMDQPASARENRHD